LYFYIYDKLDIFNWYQSVQYRILNKANRHLIFVYLNVIIKYELNKPWFHLSWYRIMDQIICLLMFQY